MPTRIEDRYCYQGLGFPVMLLNVPMSKLDGRWTPSIDYEHLAREVVTLLLCRSQVTPEQARFLRIYHYGMPDADPSEPYLTSVEISRDAYLDDPVTITYERTT